MALYSKSLARAFVSATGFTNIYTVPAGGGPAILKHMSGLVGAGNVLQLLIHDSINNPRLEEISNAAGTGDLVVSKPGLFHVLGPGDILAVHCSTAANSTVVVSGYYFDTP